MAYSRLRDLKTAGYQPADDRYAYALLWGLLGAMAAPEGKRIQAGIAFAIGSPFLEQLAVGLEQQRQGAMRQERLACIQATMQPSQPISVATQAGKPLEPIDAAVPLTQKLEEMEKDSQWRKVIVHPSIVLVLGKRGSGKSALGYRLLELFRYGLTPYVLGVPKQAHGLLPEWMGNVTNLEDLPEKSIALIDEAYLRYHSRESLGSASRLMSRILNLSRQRQQSLVFVSQEARQVDKNIASSANVVVFKDLAMLQLQFDRPELNKLAAQARQAFEAVKGDEKRWSYVYSPDANFQGLLENSLPSFWRSKLSHAFAVGGEASETRLPKRMTLQERIRKAKEMHQGGLSYQQIASVLGVTKSSAYNYVNGYPHVENANHG
jgi:hypothetical protein